MFIEVEVREGPHTSEKMLVAVAYISHVVMPSPQAIDHQDTCFLCFKGMTDEQFRAVCIGETYDAFKARLREAGYDIYEKGE